MGHSFNHTKKIILTILIFFPAFFSDAQPCLNGYWRGSVNTDWNNQDNWCNGLIPSDTSVVVITANRPNYPSIPGGNISVRNVVIEAGASLTVGNATLKVEGQLMLSGALNELPGAKIIVEGKPVDIGGVDHRVRFFMSAYKIPGMSIAIAKHGKLVYRKGYGYADTVTREAVNVDHRFRIASVSKTYASVSIMQLVQEGKLGVNDKVFGNGGVLGFDYGTQPYATRLTKITVEHLLKMTSGGWGNINGDPIDLQPQMNNKQFFDWVLNTRPLTNEPGTRFEYSNFNYFILARIVEKITGKTYIDYLKQDVLNKVGALKTEPAGEKLSELRPDEVKYYGQNGDHIYVYRINFKRRDADAGLITTPTDMLRFFLAIDGFTSRPDILTPTILQELTRPSGPAPLDPAYASGIGKWQYLQNTPTGQKLMNYWYNFGSIVGTCAGVIRSDAGLTISVVCNSLNRNLPYTGYIQQLILTIMNDLGIVYQDVDMF